MEANMKGRRISVITIFSAVLSFAFVLSLRTQSVWAQVSVYGNLSGLVTDTSQAVVPGAAVSVENDKTKVISKAVTNESGAYTFLTLISGTYTVTVEKGGFKKFIRENVVVGVGI